MYIQLICHISIVWQWSC